MVFSVRGWRLKKLRPLLLAIILFLIYKLYLALTAGHEFVQYAAVKQRDSRASRDTVDPFAGSDVVAYVPSSADHLWLQGFNGATYQLGVTFEWRQVAGAPLGITGAHNSVVGVSGLQSAKPGIYTFELQVSNDRGESAKDTVSIHVMPRPSVITQDDLRFMQTRLGERLIVVLPETSAQVSAASESVAKKYKLQEFVWEKQSGSPARGECQGDGRQASCTDLVEGVYTYWVLATGPGVRALIPVVVAVYPENLRIYDHASTYRENEAVLPVYIKKEPIVPECELDPTFSQPSVNEELLLEHLKARALPETKTVLIGFTGDSYLTLAHNWACSVKRILGDTGYLIVTFDATARDAMRELERKTGGDAKAIYYDETLLEGKSMKFQPRGKDAHQAWKQIMNVKTTVIEAIVRNGYNVFIMDADTVLLGNPFQYMTGRANHCDYQWQADGKDKFLFDQLQWRTHFNAGVYYANSNERTKRMYAKWLEAYRCKKGRREQHALTIVLHNTFRGQWTLHDPVLAPRVVPDHVVRFCYLDAMKFPDGGYFVFHDAYEAAFGPEPSDENRRQLLLHANNLEQDEVAKKNALVNARAWFLDATNLVCSSE